jgi:hypothetical protein
MATPQSSSAALPTKFWTEAEDQILRKAVSEQQHEEATDWHQVAAQLPDRTNKDCRKRWVYALLPSLNKGVWTEEEIQLLQEGVRTYGNR